MTLAAFTVFTIVFLAGVLAGVLVAFRISRERVAAYREALVRNRDRYEQLRVDTLERLLADDVTGPDVWK